MQAEREDGLELLLAARRMTLLVLAVLSATLLGADGPEDIPPIGSTFSGQVVGVHDGDTISVMNGERAERVRLEGIDCPEDGQDFSTRAKHATSDLVFRHVVVVERRGRDRYGRTLGRVFVSGLDVNLELVRQGMAWHFTRYSSERGLSEAQTEARAAKRGLWSQPDQVPPWEWRSRKGRRGTEAGITSRSVPQQGAKRP